MFRAHVYIQGFVNIFYFFQFKDNVSNFYIVDPHKNIFTKLNYINMFINLKDLKIQGIQGRHKVIHNVSKKHLMLCFDLKVFTCQAVLK